jgi:hypothetical protein
VDQPWTYVAVFLLLTLAVVLLLRSVNPQTCADVYTALKWGTHTALQLSAEEVLQLADLLGFEVDYSSRKSIDSLYAEQPETLLRYTYGECLPSSPKRPEQ